MRWSSRIALAALATFTLAACDDDDPVRPTTQGRVRAVHAISNVATMDILFNTTSYKTNVAYKGSDGYKATAVGATAVRFRKAGVAADLQSANATVANGADYTVIALGTEAAPQSLVLTDDNATPAAGKVKLRAIHAAAGAGAVDVYVLTNANDLATATPAASNLAARAASAYIDRDAGTYVVIFTGTGNKTALLTVADVQVAAGGIRSIIAVEKTGGGTPLEGIVLTDR